MELFWKRADKHENEPDDRSETAGRAAAQFELIENETATQPTIELENPKSKIRVPAKAGDPKSALFFRG